MERNGFLNQPMPLLKWQVELVRSRQSNRRTKWCQMVVVVVVMMVMVVVFSGVVGGGGRGVRYIDEKISKANKSVFYRYQKMNILKLSTNYRYRKLHQIWSDKYMKSQKYQTTNFNKFLPKKCTKNYPFLHRLSSTVDVSCEKHNS